MKTILILTLLPVFALAVEPTAFFNQHCTKCHGAEKQKGDLRLDSLPTDPEIWLEIADRLDLAEMPPEDEPQPAAADLKAVIAIAKERVSQAAKPKQVVLRRINRAQYRNSLRDLLLIDTFVEDPTEAFPADDEEEGFDNLGETLQMSDFLLRQYLKVARKAVDRATFEGEMPEAQTFTHRATKSRALNWKAPGNDPERDYIVLYQNDERASGDPRGQNFINCRQGATHDGWYDFTFEVESKGRGNLAEAFSVQKRDDYQVYRPEDLHRFEIYLTAPNATSQIQTRPRHLVAAYDLPDNERQKIEKRLWLPKGWRVEVGFGNGYFGVTDPILLVDPDFDLEAFRELPKRDQNGTYGKLLLDRLEAVDGPRIVIHDLLETGPHYEEWPPRSQKIVYGEDLRQFAERAFRRPVTEAEIGPYRRLAETSPEGVRTAIEAILCSPRFLYLDEPEGELDDYAIASRLSYFLWNTMPDEALLTDAKNGRLRDPAILENQLERLLADEQANEFIESFVWAWLKLDNTVEMAPDPMKFFEYHRNRIDEAMVVETTKFVQQLLTENLPISTFLDSDFAFLNANLARHYGLAGKVNTTAEFQRVSLAGIDHRGGLLGQTSVLTASANGVDTSPVIRGIWILENLLGTPPSLPPPDVEIPEPDARGELTIRELYAKHRTVESCNDCHKKIDPLGFALENFDATGSWRTSYESGHQINPSGKMPSGEDFQDIAGLKEILTRDFDLFSRNLTTKILTYATGRTMEASDRKEIDRIASKPDLGFRDLLKLVVTSEIFLRK
ncbi:MAG: hypothetical protein ACI8UO_000698 [Verrucomicrobiales bacterium]|jgi:hypothetical protein